MTPAVDAGTAPGAGGGPSLVVVVCGYTPARSEQLLAAAAEARAQADGPGDEVVVVVDHHDGLLEHLRPRVAPGVRVVASTGAPGLSGARNTGTACTRADALVFLDDDALPRPGWVRAVRARLGDPSVAVVAGAVHARWEAGSPPRWFPAEYGWVVGCDYRGMPGDGAVLRNPIGACMAVRRGALEAAGGFSDELGRVGSLPVGCEETLMAIRVRQHDPGARVVRDTAFAVDHWVPLARGRARYFVRRCFHEGRSKAVLARRVGAGAALSSERAYVVRTLGTAVLRAAGDLARGDLAAPLRAVAVVVGAGAAAVGMASALRSR